MFGADDQEQLGLMFHDAAPERPMRSFIRPRVHVELVRDPEPFEPITLRRSSDIYSFLKDEVAVWDRERLLTIMLNQKHVIIGIEEVGVGSLTQTIVHPREVFKALLLSNSAAFVLAHNHPSGDPTPSQEDIAITRRLREVGDLFGIRLLDHIVIGAGSYVSLVEGGYW